MNGLFSSLRVGLRLGILQVLMLAFMLGIG